MRALIAVARLPAIEVLGAAAVEGLVSIHGEAVMTDADETLIAELEARGAVRVEWRERSGDWTLTGGRHGLAESWLGQRAVHDGGHVDGQKHAYNPQSGLTRP